MDLNREQKLSSNAAYFIQFVCSYAIEDILFSKEEMVKIINLAGLKDRTEYILDNLKDLKCMKGDMDDTNNGE